MAVSFLLCPVGSSALCYHSSLLLVIEISCGLRRTGHSYLRANCVVYEASKMVPTPSTINLILFLGAAAIISCWEDAISDPLDLSCRVRDNSPPVTINVKPSRTRRGPLYRQLSSRELSAGFLTGCNSRDVAIESVNERVHSPVRGDPNPGSYNE